MLETIPVPAQSKFGAAVARRLNASRPIAPAGSLAMSGPTGTGFAPLPSNRRDRRQAKAADRSCFRIETRQKEDGSASAYLTCCYYHVGGVTRHMDDVSVDGLIPSSGSPEDKTPRIICLKLSGDVSSPSIVAIEENSLEGEQRIADNYVLPLYRYLGSTLHDDLRNAPQLQLFEEALS